jgi:ABC-type branched-subunit amino acid transport system substrate-binding protein
MTPWMQIRLWYRKASSTQRLGAFTAIGIVVSLLVASIAIAPSDSQNHDTAVAATGGGGGGGESAGGIPGGTAGGVGGAGGGSSALSSGAGGTSVAGVGGRSTGASGAGGQTAAGSTALTASDRGVSPRDITLGFMLQNAAGLDKAGFSTGQRGDGTQYINALAAWANQQGGADGRKIVPVARYTDPTSVDDQAAACRAMVDDAKVFGVVDTASMLDTASLDCLTNLSKGNTPMVHSVEWSTDWQKRSGGNDVSYQAAVDRISITWARDLAATGWLQPGAVVGILGDKCPATEPTVENVLGPALKAKGAKDVVYGLHDCDIQSVATQPPNIVTQFRLKGVTNVLIVSNFVAGQIFTSTAASQGYHPKYSTSDWFLNSSDQTDKNFDPSEFDGAIGIASLGTMLVQSGKPPYPGWETCSKIATDAGLPGIRPDDPASTEILTLCDNFILLLDALKRAGPNPTRAGWRAAVQQLGQHTSTIFGRSFFAPGKFTGSDFVHTIQWQAGCKCWKSISDFRPAAA